MKSRVSFFKLIVSDLKRRIWVPSVLLLLYIVSGPVFLLIQAENGRMFTSGKDYIDYMVNCLRPHAMVMIPTIAIASLVLALSGFSYLFSKKKVDLFHSLPVKREKLFLVQYCSGILVFIGIVVIKFTSIFAIASMGGYLTKEAISNIFIYLIGELIIFFFAYNVNILAIMLTGNIVIALLGIGALNFYYPLFTTAFEYLKSYCFVTAYNGQSVYEKYPYLSPLMVLIEYIKCEEDTYAPVKNIPILLTVSFAVAVIVGVAAFYLYKIRPSESCGKAMAFEKSKPIIRNAITVLGGLLGIVVVAINVNRHMSVWVWIGLVLGIIIAHCTMEVIFNSDFKAALNDYKQMLVCLVAVVIVLVIYSQDLFGYDRFIPNENKILEASISIPSLDSDLSCFEVEDINEKKEVKISYMSRDNYVKEHMMNDPEIIKTIYEFNETGLTFVDKMKANLYREGDKGITYAAKEEVVVGEDPDAVTIPLDSLEIREETDGQQSLNEISVTIFYKLNNGKEVARYYTVDRNAIVKLIGKLYENETFKKNHYGLYESNDLGVINSVEVVDTFSERQLSVVGENTAEFMEAYLKDLSKTTIEDLKGLPIAVISPKMKTMDGYNETYSGYYIYPSYKNTIAYMKKYNVNMSGMTIYPDAKSVQSISVSAYDYVYNKESNEAIYVSNLMYLADEAEGKAMIDDICSKVKLYNFGWSNADLMDKENRVELMIYYNIEGGIQKCSTAYFNKGDVPNILKNDILEYAAEHPNNY